MTRRCRWLLLCGVLLLARPAESHPSPFSFIDLRIGSNHLDVTLTVHVFDLAHDAGIEPMERLLDPGFLSAHGEAIEGLLAHRFAVSLDGEPIRLEWPDHLEVLDDRQAIQASFHHATAGDAGTVGVSARMFPYDPVHQTFVNVYEDDDLRTQAILDDSHATIAYFAGTRQGREAVVRRFLPAGIRHILIGPDHLLFLVGLLLAGGTARRLLVMATAFTVAHSVTLSLAVLGILAPAPGLVEPAIALSIVCVGADNLLNEGGRDLRVWMALAFGFIHGFGFASVLREMELPTGALGWSLFSFNVGVEIGQAVVVVLVASALAVLCARYGSFRRRVALVGSLIVGAAGAFWFVQRVFFTGGI